ncbi:uncharacterized protein LOC144748777 [Ciona intestinalis]
MSTKDLASSVLFMIWITLPAIVLSERKPSFYRETTEEYSYSFKDTTTTEFLFNMCFQTPPKAAAVKVKPADSSLQLNFEVLVLEILQDRVQVRLERTDANEGWGWMVLTVEWIVYTDDVGADWQKYNGYAYKVLEGGMTYEKAKEACRSEGAWLPVYGPMEIAAHGGNNYNYVFGDHHWIGLKKDYSTGRFFWENWTTLSLENKWKPGEPHSNNNKFCVINHTGNKESTKPSSSNVLSVSPSDVSFSTTRIPGKLVVCDVNEWCDLMTTDQAFRKSIMEIFEPLPVSIVDSHYTIVCGSDFNQMLYICRVLEYCGELSQISIKIMTRPPDRKQGRYNELNEITSGESLLPHSKSDILMRRMQNVRLF